MRAYEDLVREAVTAGVTGWHFGWLEGRATEERPPWGYAHLLAARLREVESALDIDTGGGEVVGEAAVLPARMAATEAWPPNAARAHRRLRRRGVGVVGASADRLPFPDATFALVTSRHPVRPHWAEIQRIRQPGGHYFAQHVGPSSAFELIEYFLGPLPREGPARDPSHALRAAGWAAAHGGALRRSLDPLPHRGGPARALRSQRASIATARRWASSDSGCV
jgi:SAM-dependent methyltransferase